MLTSNRSGGGNVPNPEMDRSQPPLRWMSYEASAAGLRLLPFDTAWEIKANLAVHESLTTIWWLFEALPWKRLTYRNEHGQTNRYALNNDVSLVHGILTIGLPQTSSRSRSSYSPGTKDS